jgi:hypothetical protein
MPDIKQQLREYVEASVERVDAADLRAALKRPAETPRRRLSLRPVWAFALGAATALAIGAVVLLATNTGDGTGPRTDTTPAGPISVREGDSILATTLAGLTPPQATCPASADPDAPGVVEQDRPWGATWSNQAAAFDVRRGTIILIDETSATWLFDVCTNTWTATTTSLGMVGAQLVYDADSDVTIAIGERSVATYDAAADAWTRVPTEEHPTGAPGLGAVYDPLSGLIVVQTTSGLVTYDVDTNTWSPIGGVVNENARSYLIGYLPEIDRFVLLDGFGGNAMLVDPGTGMDANLLPPPVEVFAGFGRLNFAVDGDSAYYVNEGSVVCRLDPFVLDWSCLGLTDGPGEFGGLSDTGLLAAVVGDPINDRVVFLYGYGSGFDGKQFHEVNDIWAIDFDSGEWTLLLDRSGEMTIEP